MRFIDLFAGIGGFRLGFERANRISTNPELRAGDSKGQGVSLPKGRGRRNQQKLRCVWGCEIDKYCRQIYDKNFGKEPEGGDIRAVRPEDIPEAELYTFGWPCQDNSIAGKRKGQAFDTRSGLLFEAVRIIRAKKPDYFIAENVKGLYSVNEGVDFIETVRMLTYLNDGLPQYSLQCQLLNTRWFLPQNRERIFFVGHLRGKRRPEIFPIGEELEEVYEEGDGKGVAGTIETRNQGGEGQWDWSSTLIDANYHKRLDGHGQRTVVDDTSGLPLTSNAIDADGFLRFGKRPRDAKGKPQLIPITYRRIRRLVPCECERLQGFPDGWTEGVSDTQRYKMLGNAVTVDVVECIARKLLTSPQ